MLKVHCVGHGMHHFHRCCEMYSWGRVRLKPWVGKGSPVRFRLFNFFARASALELQTVQKEPCEKETKEQEKMWEGLVRKREQSAQKKSN